MKKIIFISFILLSYSFNGFSQVFSNSTVSAAGFWNGTLTKTVTVSGLSNLNAGIFELVQVNLHMGDDANTRNYNNYRITLTKGTTSIELVALGGFPNSTVKQINTKFRYNPYLRRLFEHGGTAEPFGIGYYRSQDDLNAFNGIDPNGVWTITITETSTATGGRFNKVDLVFKSPYTVQDYTTLTSYDNCATPYCLGTAEIIVASNNGFTNQPGDMYNPNTTSCSWNAAQNNSAFFKFRAAQTSGSITISGISGNLQILAIDAGPDNNPCTAVDNIVLNGGCPTLSINDTYSSPQYTNGSTKNNQLNFSGLTVGEFYYFIVDGTSSSVSPFYIETIGTSFDCSNCDLNATLGSNSPVCENNTLNLTCSDGSIWAWTGPDGFTSPNQNPTINNVTALASGTYTVVITDAIGCTETKSINVIISPIIVPTFNTPSPVCIGSTLNPLPTTSNNGIIGSWSPALNNAATTTYTFTPDAGQCATLTTLTITINNCDFGAYATAIWMDDCTDLGDGKFYNTTGGGADLINQEPGNTFIKDFGVHIENSSSLIFRGAEVKTYKNGGTNVCSTKMYYRYYLTSVVAGAFIPRNLAFFSDCNTGTSEFINEGGPCIAGQQKWQCVSQPGCDAPVNLTNVPPGDYTLEVYYDVTGDFNSTTQCDDTIILNNGGTNYKANFSIIALPTLSNTNPTTCNGTEGSITISGLKANEVYALSYLFNSTSIGPINFTSNNSGQILISNLSIGTYSNFSFVINSCTTILPSSVTLQNPVITPVFSTPNPFCFGATVPSTVFPTTSNNGIAGSWLPALNNTVTTTYTFTPDANQCATTTNLTVVINPEITGGINTNPNTACFTIPATACNGSATVTITQGSGNYSYLWNDTLAQTGATATNLCAGNYCVNVTDLDTNCTQQFCTTVIDNIPNVTPTFSFGTTLSICSGGVVPTLPTTSGNSITGVWTPAIVDNANNGTYTFTPNAGQCANTSTFTVTITPQTTPIFGFGTSLTSCQGDVSIQVLLPTLSNNSISGTWNPSTIDYSILGQTIYTFTPDAGQCANNTTFTVTITPQTTPTFSFGTTLSICSGGIVPTLPTSSSNSITGLWLPAIVDNANNGTYTFTPDAGQCANNTTFTVTIISQTTPTFSFGTTLSICSGGIVPTLPTTSNNSITGTWSPAIVDNANNGTYTFTPDSGQCANTTTFTVTITPQTTPTFSFGTTLSICSGGIVPSLPATSSNSITGVWSPAIVDNANNGTYTFTPNTGQCANSTTFTVTITPQITPTFTFGTTLSICSGGTVPALPTSSSNSITGTWSPAIVDNANSGTYTFTPNTGQCANTTTFTVTITPQITPTFTFGTTLSICSGGIVPALPTSSSDSITGTWSPAIVDNANNGTYTFTPNTGQCANTTTFTVTVTPQTIPTFGFGTTLTNCQGVSAQVLLPTTSDNFITGSWNPSTIDNSLLGETVYTFTPNSGQCSLNRTLTVTINTIPQFTITGGCDGEDYVLKIEQQNQNINTVEWYFNSNMIGQGNSIVITGEGAYTAVATNSFNCDNSAQFVVSNDFCTIQKGISVNNDGLNDVFELTNLNVKNLQIFNRYGMEVYSKRNYTNEWGGNSNDGDELPDGTYYYVIEQRSGTVKTGWIYINRAQ
jgi:gliding motility-associated-like protein